MVQIVLICLTTALVFLVITDVSDYRRNLSILWKNLFLTNVSSCQLRMAIMKGLIHLIRNIYTTLTKCAIIFPIQWIITTQ